MAAICVLALLMYAVAAFEGMERDRGPVLITRRGRPVAALVPVDSEQAEAMILSSAPELIESRRRAQNARAEGRTTPLEVALRDLDAEEAEDTAQTGGQVAGKATASYDYLVRAAGHGVRRPASWCSRSVRRHSRSALLHRSDGIDLRARIAGLQ